MKLQKTPTRTLGKPLVIKGVSDATTLKVEATKLAGRALGNLVRASDNLDTKASTEILDRAVGKVAQGVEHSGEVVLTLRALNARAAHIAPAEVLRIDDASE